VIDDIRPLRSVTKEILSKPLHLFEIGDTQAHAVRQKEGSRFLGEAEFRGENEPYGALLTYSLNFSGIPPASRPSRRTCRRSRRRAR
jgi:hypothetical protein